MKNTQIFHFTSWPFQTVFTCPNSIIKTEKHCAKHVQSETKNKFCKIKCVKLSFYKFVYFLLLLLLSTLWIYYFHCFPISFLLLYLSFHLDPVRHHPDFPHFSHFHPDSTSTFYEISYFSSKTKTSLYHYYIILVPNHCLYHLRRYRWYHQKRLPWSA